MKVLIVPDKFKGTLSARSAAALIAEGWRRVRSSDELELLPMSDGGDGFGEVLAGLLDMHTQSTPTMDAAHRPLDATWWWNPSTRLALIESAQVIGLALLPPKQRHPFELDTFGLGAVLRAAEQSEAKQILIGIGGSATNDGGFGLARALGWRFLDVEGREIEKWIKLSSLAKINPPLARVSQSEVVVAVDVQNPLLGPNGATRVYGPQKGLRIEDFALAESCLGRLAEIAERDLHLKGVANEPGTGAAGGLGFGLRCFPKAHLESGFGLFTRYARLEKRIRAAELVITGEGAIDSSTLMGKGVGEVTALGRRYSVPCIGLAGTLALPSVIAHEAGGFAQVYGIVPELTTSLEEATAQAHLLLPRLAAAAATQWIPKQTSKV